MANRRLQTSPERVGEEVVANIKDPSNNALLLVMATVMPEGCVIRMAVTNGQDIPGIITHHAIAMGKMQEAMAMAEQLIKIGRQAKAMIISEDLKRQQSN